MNMDPQQRLLLEVAWEALENAGQVPGAVARTGVYVGTFLDDYLQLDFAAATPRQIDAYNTLGLLRGLSAGRLAYVLDLHGPAMQLDTACSSSLLAAHLAVQGLRNRECDLALAGGVNLILVPEVTIGLCRLKAMAADGRCKTLLGSHPLRATDYKIYFVTSEYFSSQKLPSLYPYVEIVFTVADPAQHYHIPLLLTANGYTTYRGS